MKESLKCFKCGCPVITQNKTWQCPACGKRYTIHKNIKGLYLEEVKEGEHARE